MSRKQLEDLQAALLRKAKLTSWVDSRTNSITILLPLSEIARNLSGRSYLAVPALAGELTGSYDLIRARAADLRDRGLSIRVGLSSTTRLDTRGRCCAIVCVWPEAAGARRSPEGSGGSPDPA